MVDKVSGDHTSQNIVGSKDVSAQYTSKSAVSSFGKVTQLQITGGKSPFWRYIVSVIKNIGLYLSFDASKRSQAFKSQGLEKSVQALNALAPETKNAIDQHVMTLSDPERLAPLSADGLKETSTTVKGSDGKSVQEINPATGQKEYKLEKVPSALDTYAQQIKEEMSKTDGAKKNLFYLPIATLLGSESHVVGLVVDTASQQLLFLDTKGDNPAKLYLSADATNKKTSTTSCLDIIQQVTQKAGLAHYELVLTPNIQKARDCTLCVTAMVGAIAKSAAQGSPIDFLKIVADIHQNYDQIDLIRAQCSIP